MNATIKFPFSSIDMDSFLPSVFYHDLKDQESSSPSALTEMEPIDSIEMALSHKKREV